MAKKPKIQTRKPPSTAALEQFVAGGGATPKARDGHLPRSLFTSA